MPLSAVIQILIAVFFIIGLRALGKWWKTMIVKNNYKDLVANGDIDSSVQSEQEFLNQYFSNKKSNDSKKAIWGLLIAIIGAAIVLVAIV